jgi:putative flavoprotein involved in K+ transport
MPGLADVVVIGAGQAEAAAGYYLRSNDMEFVILDTQDAPGGAWRHGWDSLRLFSPASYSSLPGRPMPATGRDYPSAAHVVDCITDYEKRNACPSTVPSVSRECTGMASCCILKPTMSPGVLAA